MKEGKEIVETVTLPGGSKDDAEDDDGIADMPPVPSHSKARLRSRSSAASP